MKYVVEMRVGQDIRHVDASCWDTDGNWLIFFQKPPQGGLLECWRVQAADVISIGNPETGPFTRGGQVVAKLWTK